MASQIALHKCLKASLNYKKGVLWYQSWCKCSEKAFILLQVLRRFQGMSDHDESCRVEDDHVRQNVQKPK